MCGHSLPSLLVTFEVVLSLLRPVLMLLLTITHCKLHMATGTCHALIICFIPLHRNYLVLLVAATSRA